MRAGDYKVRQRLVDINEQEAHLKKVELIIKEMVPQAVECMRVVSVYGMASIRGVFLLNGAGAVAALTKISEQGQMHFLVIMFGAIGAGLAVLCAGASYASQSFFLHGLAHIMLSSARQVAGEQYTPPPVYKIMGRVFQALSIACFLGSLSVFSYGLYRLIQILPMK